MRYLVNFKAPLGRQLQRYTESLVDDLVLELLRTRYDLQTGIHGARKLVKEIRAVLRLLKPLQGETHFDNWQLLKTLASTTSELRDKHVSEQLWQALAKELSDHPDYALISSRFAEQDKMQQQKEKLRYTVDETVEQLQVLSTLLLQRKRQLLAPPRSLDVNTQWLAGQYGLLYKQAARAFVRAREQQVAEDRHDLRKRCKDLHYALRLCKPAWNSTLRGQVEQLGQVSDWLGDANDLAVIESLTVPMAINDPEGLQTFLSRRREILWSAVDDHLDKMFSREKSWFVKKMAQRLQP
jgi:CHAD domain-containing protein